MFCKRAITSINKGKGKHRRENLTSNALRCGSHSVTCQSHHTCNANDAKTFLKHFSDCLFYICSTCADSITNNHHSKLLFGNDQNTE